MCQCVCISTKPHSQERTIFLLVAMAKFLIFVSLVTVFFLFSEANATAPRRALSSADTIAAFLVPQNTVRAKLGLPPLQWSNNLVKFAKSYANQRRGDCALIHSTSNYGENLFWGKGNQWTISDAIAAWAAEQAYYTYSTNTCSPGADCTHYTQMVWRTTQRVGCVKIICNSGDTFIICNYDPHGNVIGSRPY